MLSSIVKKSDTKTTYSPSENNRSTRIGNSSEKSAIAKAMSSAHAQRESFSTVRGAFPAQRSQSSLQSSSSKDLRSTALDSRDFQPALRGPSLTGKAMSGMHRWANALYTPAATKTVGHKIVAEINKHRGDFSKKQQFINDLTAEINNGDLPEGQIQLKKQAIAQARQEAKQNFEQLQTRLDQMIEQARQNVRNR